MEQVIELVNNNTRESIFLLRQYREFLWDDKEMASCLIENFIKIPSMKEEIEERKQYLSEELYREFEQEFNLTIMLLNKCLEKARKENLVPQNDHTKNLLKQTEGQVEFLVGKIENSEEILLILRRENPIFLKYCQSLELPEDKIQKLYDQKIDTYCFFDQEERESFIKK